MYDCSACAANPDLKIILGHDGPPTPQLWERNLITREPLARCPLRTIQLAPPGVAAELQRYADRYVPAYEDGHLLVSGGWGEQPARYAELVQMTVQFKRQSQERYDELTQDDGAE